MEKLNRIHAPQDLYKEVLLKKAYDFMSSGKESITVFFEENCNGPIFQETVRLNGANRVINDLIETINNLNE
jgi:hypothetical protein